MTAGPVNRALLESNFQNPGDVYSDLKTEGAFDVVADQIDDNYAFVTGLIANGTLSPYPAFLSRQALINGNFDIWQRGTTRTDSVFDVTAYLADRWSFSSQKDGATFPTITQSRIQLTSGDIPNAFYGYRINTNGAGTAYGINSQFQVRQMIENGTRLLCGAGKKVTVSFWAKSDIVGKRIGVCAVQNYGTGGAPSSSEIISGNNFTLTTTFQQFTLTLNTNTLVGKTFGTNNDDNLDIRLQLVWGSNLVSRFASSTAETFVGAGNIDIAQVQVVAGDTAIPFQPKSFEEELRSCQRYYEKSYNYVNDPAAVTTVGITYYNTRRAVAASTAGVLVNTVYFKSRKRTNPTVTIYSPTGTANAVRVDTITNRTGVTAGVVGETSFAQLDVNNTSTTVISLDSLIEYEWTADAEL